MQVTINSSCVKSESDKALLIKIPSKRECFWYPKRFCSFDGKYNHLLRMWFANNFKIKVFKFGTKRHIEVGEFNPEYIGGKVCMAQNRKEVYNGIK